MVGLQNYRRKVRYYWTSGLRYSKTLQRTLNYGTEKRHEPLQLGRRTDERSAAGFYCPPVLTGALLFDFDCMLVSTEPRCADDGRYNVSQTCALLGIHRNTLERYRKAQAIRCGWRKSITRKFYTGKEIKRLWRTL